MNQHHPIPTYRIRFEKYFGDETEQENYLPVDYLPGFYSQCFGSIEAAQDWINQNYISFAHLQEKDAVFAIVPN